MGETGLSFRKRINIHRSDVRLKKDTAVATHFNSGSCRATHLRVLYLEVLKNTGDITLNNIGRLEAERKWQLALKTYSPFGLNTVPSPKDNGVTPFVITYSATAVEAAKLVKTSFNKLKAKHPNILYKHDKRCVTAFKRGQKLRDLLVRSRLGEAPLDNPTVTGSDSSQDLTTLVNALDEVQFISISMIVFLFINQAILLLGQCTRLGTWKGMPLKGWRKSDPLGYDESTVDRLIPGCMGNQVLEPLPDPNHGP